MSITFDGDVELDGVNDDDGYQATLYVQVKLATDSWVVPTGDSSHTAKTLGPITLSWTGVDGGTYNITSDSDTVSAAELMSKLTITSSDVGTNIEIRFYIDWDFNCDYYSSGADATVTANTLTATGYAPLVVVTF